MKISSKGRYGLLLMLDLAMYDTGTFISLNDISGRTGITQKYLEQIVTSLYRAGLVRSQRGIRGGYRLAKSPKDITAGDILRVMEGSLDPGPSPEERNEKSYISFYPCMIGFWDGFADVVNRYVDSITLQDLKDQTQELAGNDYVI